MYNILININYGIMIKRIIIFSASILMPILWISYSYAAIWGLIPWKIKNTFDTSNPIDCIYDAAQCDTYWTGWVCSSPKRDVYTCQEDNQFVNCKPGFVQNCDPCSGMIPVGYSTICNNDTFATCQANCKTSSTWSVSTYNCNKWCSKYYTVPKYQSTITLTVTYPNSWTWTFWEHNKTLWNQNLNECKTYAYVWINKISPSKVTLTCEKGTHDTYVWGTNWTCNPTKQHRDYLLNPYNQVNWFLWWYLWPITNWDTCKTYWLYSDLDNIESLITTSLDWKVFDNNLDDWCNLNKYRWEGAFGSYQPIGNPWCEAIRKKNIVWNPMPGEDLLKWLKITIWQDTSWIWEVKVVLWTWGICQYRYLPNNSSLANIVNNPNLPNWVNSNYTNQFDILYDSSFTALGKTQPSLLAAFGKDRLDKCLSNWRNTMEIYVYDMARSIADGITLSGNLVSQEIKYINIDNDTPKLNLSSDLSSTYLSWSTNINYFYNNVTSYSDWRNYTLEWNMSVWEVFSWSAAPCIPFSTWSATCPWWPLPSWPWLKKFVSPVWVDPLSWVFETYTCGTLTLPTISDCEIGCSVGQVYNTWSDICETLTWSFMPYCLADETIACVVAPDNCSSWIIINWICQTPYCKADWEVDCVVAPDICDGKMISGVCVPYCKAWSIVSCVVAP